MCWERSHIPETIWQVADTTSNIIESLHFEANTEGISCTLVGGVQRGQHLDLLKERTLSVRGALMLPLLLPVRVNLLQTWEATGVRPSYSRGHISENTSRSLKRKSELRISLF